MTGNPFDLNRDGRWSMPERALTHYGVDPLLRDGGGGGGDGREGCGCLLFALAVLAALGVVIIVLANVRG